MNAHGTFLVRELQVWVLPGSPLSKLLTHYVFVTPKDLLWRTRTPGNPSVNVLEIGELVIPFYPFLGKATSSQRG
jgi:hypothetical protein